MKRIKFNWGFGIAATYILFMLGSLIMVAIFMNQNVSLETEYYYSKGIEYQNHIDKVKRTQALPEQLSILQQDAGVILIFPELINPKSISGIIHFYKPSENLKDFFIEVRPDSSGVQLIENSRIGKGLWKIKVDWQVSEISYYNEKILMVN